MDNDLLEDAKKQWREHPEMPGYCTINMNGSIVTPAILEIAATIKTEFGEVYITNCGEPIYG